MPNCFENPSLTPRTMLFSSALLNPCNALDSASSPLRLTVILSPSTFAEVRGCSSRFSLPFGPSAEILCPLTATFTFGGITIGCFPIRDIYLPKILPDVANQLAAQVVLSRLIAGHHALRRRNHRDSQ